MKKVILLSPHPDDECLTGLLAIRALSEGAEIYNFAMSLGSKVERQKERLIELKNACQKLNFKLIEADFSNNTVLKIKNLNGDLIICPHINDYHPTHIKVAQFLMDNLKEINPKKIAFSEFWFPQEKPNLMIECSAENKNIIIEALRCHIGEIQRNPYHETFEAWTIDNARRGFEYLQGFGKNTSTFSRAVLYKLFDFKNGQLNPVSKNQIIATHESVLSIL